MKKIITALTLLLGVTLCTQPLYAEEKIQEHIKEQKGDSTSLWDSIRKKIETFTPKKKLIATTAVGGVRGALVESDDLYWKGEISEKVIDANEFDEFENALTLYESGNSEGAHSAFSQFVSDYPDSILIPDANQALDLLSPAQ